MEWLFFAAVVVGFIFFTAVGEGVVAEIIGRIVLSLQRGRLGPKSRPVVDSDNSRDVEDGSDGSKNT